MDGRVKPGHDERFKDVDGRDKPGHDEKRERWNYSAGCFGFGLKKVALRLSQS
jgi:hypothetical protein